LTQSRKFKKKTGLVVEIIKRLVTLFQGFGKEIEIIVDGGYAKDTVLLPLGKLDDSGGRQKLGAPIR
jgi:hypothetical protein